MNEPNTAKEYADGLYKATMDRAIEFAFNAHKGQYRKGSLLPYIVHPIAVMNTLVSWGVVCYETLTAAVCHDVLEECPHITPHAMHTVLFSKTATDIVVELTFDPNVCNKAAYMDSFGSKSVMALLIKLADRFGNTMDFDSNPETRDYAPKYFGKASNLFDLAEARKDEIIAKFGETVYENMMSDLASMEMLFGD